MARRGSSTLVSKFRNEDLVLQVGPKADGSAYDEDRYEQFIDALCGTRDYQKEAIRTALRYLLGDRYKSLSELARESFERNTALADRYNTWDQFAASLQLADLLSGTIDLATGTGKSYVMYGIAAIMLAEGVIDSVLVLCPSTTIEKGLTDKFVELAADANLLSLLPTSRGITTPTIINASESIVLGTICVENFHAVLEHVRSSVRESLWGKGARTLVLNDEVHHVVAEVGDTRKWKEFLVDPAYGFRFVLGVSGTCYVGDNYFSDVIYRFSLREAMEGGFVKLVKYVADMPTTDGKDEKWQLIRGNHEAIKANLQPRGILPLTIIVTQTIQQAKSTAEFLKSFLMEHDKLTRKQADERVLCVHHNAADLSRLPFIDHPKNPVEWIVSVSMLSEGWDVQRVFQIVPAEERAFNSKLLISQVLGRGLRIPKAWQGPQQPEVTVFNHDAWTGRIKHLVDEVTESINRISVFPLADSPFNFTLHCLDYTRESTAVIKESTHDPTALFKDGFIELASDTAQQTVQIEMETATTKLRVFEDRTIKRKPYSPREVAQRIYDRLLEADEGADEDESTPPPTYRYTDNWTVDKLEQVVTGSLQRRGMREATEKVMQQFLAHLGSLRQGEKKVARLTPTPNKFFTISTVNRPEDSVSEGEIKQGQMKMFYYTDETAGHVKPEQLPCFEVVTDEGSGYRVAHTAETCFKTPLIAAIADSGPEAQFYRLLRAQINQSVLEGWIKSTAQGFYEITYYWRKGKAPKSGQFSPDFFIKSGDNILVVEIKDDDEAEDPSVENIHKNEAALAHFKQINEHLASIGDSTRYEFHFLTPKDYTTFFENLRGGQIAVFKSAMDVKLAALLQSQNE